MNMARVSFAVVDLFLLLGVGCRLGDVALLLVLSGPPGASLSCWRSQGEPLC